MRVEKLIAWTLCAAMVASLLPAPVFAAGSNAAKTLESVSQTVSVSPEFDAYSHDELFAAYADSVLYGYEMATFGTSAGSKLQGDEWLAYNALKTEIKKIASGQRTNASLSLGNGKPYNVQVGAATEVWTSEIKVDFKEPYAAFDADAVVSALLSDCPYELYWFDKTEGYEVNFLPIDPLSYIKFDFTVAAEYAAEGKTLETDPDKTGAAATAAANANAVVAQNASKNPYDRLVAYKEYICNAVEYNSYAADDENQVAYGNPWQLIYVFDGKPDTNVVCEGYSKAFQYLCDLDANADSFNCTSPTGYMGSNNQNGGAHMWNVVTLDGKNYLVDVTNCDGNSVGAPDLLFLKGAAPTGYTGGAYKDDNKEPYESLYNFQDGGKTVQYYCHDLNLTAENRTLDYLIVTETKNGTVTVSGDDNRAAKGQSVTLTVTPDEGYQLVQDSLTVQEQYGSDIQLDENNQFTMPAGTVIVSAQFVETEHEHNVSYVVDDEKHTINEVCSCGTLGSVALTADSKTYDGKTFEAKVDKIGTLEDESITVTYSVKDGQTSINAPKNAGDYTASITVGEQTVRVDFAIHPQAITEESLWVIGEAVTYDGTAKTSCIRVDDPNLTLGTDCTITYERNGQSTEDITSAGEVTVIMEGKGNYTGRDEDTLIIREKYISIKNAVIDPVVYNAEGKYTLTVEDVIFVNFLGEEDSPLTLGDDYTATTVLTSANEPGKATATVTVTLLNSNYGLTKDSFTDAEVEIMTHTHEWAYAPGAGIGTILATCGNTDGGCPIEEKGEGETRIVTLTLNAPVPTDGSDELVYDGKSKKATVEQSSDGAVAQSEMKITYKKHVNETTTEDIGEAKDAGTYTATLTMGSATATVNFAINKADPSYTVPTGLTATAETLKGQANGKITGLTDKMEYVKDNGVGYTAITGNKLENLAAGTYYVRYQETDNYKPGAAAEVIVAEGKPITVTFDANGQEFGAAFVAKLEGQSYGLLTRPDPDPTAANIDFEFVGWYKDSACKNAWDFNKDTLTKENVTIYAKWEQKYFKVKVDVKDHKDNAYAEAVTIQLMRDNQVIYTVSERDEQNLFIFEAHVEAGTYKLIATYDADDTKTMPVTIDAAKTITLTLPVPGVKSELNVESSAPAVMVDGLDDVGESLKPEDEEITVTMNVKGEEEDNLADDVAEAIQAAIGSETATNIAYLDISIEQSIDGAEATEITETSTVIEILIPLDGRFNVKIIRHHVIDDDNVEVKVFTQGSTKADGYFYIDRANGYIHIFTKKFSTYAVSSTDSCTITFHVNGGDGGNISKETTDGTVTLPTDPTRTDYTFKGWYTAATGGTQITAETVFTVDTTVYAQWTKNSTGNDYSGGDYDYTPPSYTVSAPARVENGSVSVNFKNASKGSTVTLTVTPDEGYELDTLIVTDKNDNEITLTAKGDGKFSFTMPASKVDIKATFVEIPVEPETPGNPFYDVAEGDYFFDAVLWANENGITSGVGNGQFAPHATCTRAQMVTFLWNAAGCPIVSADYGTFNDVTANDYYYKAVLWANANNITSGTGNGAFSPNQICTRAQMATVLYKFVEGKAEGTSNPFVDVTASDYYAQPVQWAVENGITSGTAANTFGPSDPCTRAQMVTFLYRLLAD